MRFRTLREGRLVSQEKLAEMSGLSLRTIQRVEAGHRVSYASLRALAVTLEMDVDQLERELYAMKQTTDEFVEVPRWIRIITDGGMGLGSVSRRHARILEAIFIGIGLIFLAVSFMLDKESSVTTLRLQASLALVAAYAMSVCTRIGERYKVWPIPAAGHADLHLAEDRRRERAWYVSEVCLAVLILAAVFLLAI